MLPFQNVREFSSHLSAGVQNTHFEQEGSLNDDADGDDHLLLRRFARPSQCPSDLDGWCQGFLLLVKERY